ncbi:hypothetical protein [Sporosarcina sp.]|uniref:hypothetical protein n=1 Tax=Sporosarcina sp. TaxID=49982 RepID=UPI00261CC014|nr:hypothetical protein [Sporosarcina sp.]
MFIYFTLIAVFVFSVVISAVVGFLFHQLCNQLLTSGRIGYILGMVVSVLVSIIMTKLLLFEIWYYYAAVIGVTILLYIVLVRSTKSYHK